MFKNTFLLNIYPKASKKIKFTSICSDDHGGFVTPPTSALCTVSLNPKSTKKLPLKIDHTFEQVFLKDHDRKILKTIFLQPEKYDVRYGQVLGAIFFSTFWISNNRGGTIQ